MEKAVKTAIPQLKPLMLVVLAEWYSGIIHDFRYEIKDVPKTSWPPPEDISQWDKDTLLSKILSLYDEAGETECVELCKT